MSKASVMRRNAQKVVLAVALEGMLGACATPIAYSNRPMQMYDRDTEYTTDDRLNGFSLTIYYSRYQFIPEADAVALACKSALTAIAHELAERRGRELRPINEQRIRISMGRNGVSGITSCSATTPVDYADKA